MRENDTQMNCGMRNSASGPRGSLARRDCRIDVNIRFAPACGRQAMLYALSVLRMEGEE